LDELKPRYLRALLREVSMVASDWADETFTSVFLGGGTPTTMDVDDLRALLEHLRENLTLVPDAECTIEANPDTVDERRLRALRHAGYTRLSMGAQSFDPAVLAALERVHQPEAVLAAYAAARRAGYANVNLDLIYGANGETLGSWERTLRETIGLGPEHVSAYALTIEPATPLGRKVAAGLVPAPDPDLQADMYELACAMLADAGYEHYEVSNWAKPGFECLHNLGYWERCPYLGLGAGAHSFRGDNRWWNVRPPEQYMNTVEAGALPIGDSETLNAIDVRFEDVFLRLRTFHGVSASDVEPDVAATLVDGGLLARDNGSLVPTERGMLVLNELVLSLSRLP
jgi:oxygen-independent coproporphyrinogen-3 oxidase